MTDPVPIRPVPKFGLSFGRMLRMMRIRASLSQNGLARAAGVDPAYVNRLERASDAVPIMPSRRVVVDLWAALGTGPADRERLLVAAGHCPEAIVVAGGWDGYIEQIRRTLTDDMEALTSRALRYFVTGTLDGPEGEVTRGPR